MVQISIHESVALNFAEDASTVGPYNIRSRQIDGVYYVFFSKDELYSNDLHP